MPDRLDVQSSLISYCFTFDVNAVATYAYGGGRGEPNNPYLIYTPEQMNAIGGAQRLDKHFKLMADIDLGKYEGTTFNSIGYWVTAKDHGDFTCTVDGNGHTISNFTYTGLVGRSVGLWGYVSGSNAKIANLVLTEPNVSAGINVGSLIGCLGSGIVVSCHAKGGCVHGSYEVGGLVGTTSRARSRIAMLTAMCRAKVRLAVWSGTAPAGRS